MANRRITGGLEVVVEVLIVGDEEGMRRGKKEREISVEIRRSARKRMM